MELRSVTLQQRRVNIEVALTVVGIYSTWSANLLQRKAAYDAEMLTHRRKIQMLSLNASELMTVRTSLADAMAAS